MLPLHFRHLRNRKLQAVIMALIYDDYQYAGAISNTMAHSVCCDNDVNLD